MIGGPPFRLRACLLQQLDSLTLTRIGSDRHRSPATIVSRLHHVCSRQVLLVVRCGRGVPRRLAPSNPPATIHQPAARPYCETYHTRVLLSEERDFLSFLNTRLGSVLNSRSEEDRACVGLVCKGGVRRISCVAIRYRSIAHYRQESG